jgi:4-amino-4-deoxychorismate lyase
MKFYYLLLESIRLQDGQFDLIGLHEARIKRSLELLSSNPEPTFQLENYLRTFPVPVKGLFKCRLLYGSGFSEPEYLPYQKRNIQSLHLVEDKGIDYDFKYTKRHDLDWIFHQRGACDDVLMMRNGCVTDTTYCNIAFRKGNEWFTPEHPLLAGVRRELLLQTGVLQTFPGKVESLYEFETFKLFNALINWDEADEIPVQNILTT